MKTKHQTALTIYIENPAYSSNIEVINRPALICETVEHFYKFALAPLAQNHVMTIYAPLTLKNQKDRNITITEFLYSLFSLEAMGELNLDYVEILPNETNPYLIDSVNSIISDMQENFKERKRIDNSPEKIHNKDIE